VQQIEKQTLNKKKGSLFGARVYPTPQSLACRSEKAIVRALHAQLDPSATRVQRWQITFPIKENEGRMAGRERGAALADSRRLSHAYGGRGAFGEAVMRDIFPLGGPQRATRLSGAATEIASW